MGKIAFTLVVVAGLAVLVIFGIGSFLAVDDLKQCAKPDSLVSKCAPADAIVAISGGDTPARAHEAINLYKAGWAPEIVFSGAALDASGPSNAAAMKRQAQAAGVPESAIIIEESSADTVQNASRSFALLNTARRIILVTSPYHQRRAAAEFSHVFGQNVDIVSHPTPSDAMWPPTWWLTTTGWVLALSETVKTAVVLL